MVRGNGPAYSFQSDPLVVRPGAEHANHVVDDGIRGARDPLDLHPRHLELGEVQDVVDESEQMRPVAVDDVEVFGLLRFGAVGFSQSFDESEDGRHRGADLVAHVGQELLLRAAGCYEFGSPLAYFFLDLRLRFAQALEERCECHGELPELRRSRLEPFDLLDLPVECPPGGSREFAYGNDECTTSPAQKCCDEDQVAHTQSDDDRVGSPTQAYQIGFRASELHVRRYDQATQPALQADGALIVSLAQSPKLLLRGRPPAGEYRLHLEAQPVNPSQDGRESLLVPLVETRAAETLHLEEDSLAQGSGLRTECRSIRVAVMCWAQARMFQPQTHGLVQIHQCALLFARGVSMDGLRLKRSGRPPCCSGDADSAERGR
jgi:hypothetical protein